MSNADLPVLPDFALIEGMLDTERKAIIKVNNFSEDDDDFVRTVADAKILLKFIQHIQQGLIGYFDEFPSLTQQFEKDYLPLSQFISREYVLETIFLDDCLFPEKEMFLFGQDGSINPNILKLHETAFDEWKESKRKAHLDTQHLIKEEFDFSIKQSHLGCQCPSCLGEYRGKVRETVLNEALEQVESMKLLIEEKIGSSSLEETADIFLQTKRDLDKKFHQIRYRIKRATLNRLENQVKAVIRDTFTYPSELAKKQESVIRKFFTSVLEEEDIKDDLIGEEEYKRFFHQLSTNIWRGENYLRREFKKLIKSVMVLKRKDISGTILQEYLGEFWVHSQARTIKRKIIYHMGPTNSGKTYHAINALCDSEKGCYLAPLRLLAAELFDTMNQKGVITTLLTGEEVIEVEGSSHYSSTIEMARLQQYFDCCVIDEIQMITDPQRGWAWTRALVNIFAQEVHVCGDPSVLELVQKIVELCGDELEVKNYDRMTKLQIEKKPIVLGNLQRSDALIVFSRRNALKYKMDLERLGFKVSIVYGRLSPEVRREQARKFDKEETDIMVSTDAIAMGMNLPIKRIVFSTLTKFINSQEYPISDSEIKQIAGRAGRYQRFPTGFVTCLTRVEEGIEKIEEAIHTTLDQQRKCMVGPDLDIFTQVNNALEENGLSVLRLSEFLRLFNTMIFKKPFYCVELKEMIELAEMVEDADPDGVLSTSEIFGFACAPVNLGLLEHVQYFVWILNNYVHSRPIISEDIDSKSSNIDYLETSIKCVELYQWLARHFNGKNFDFEETLLLANKQLAVDKLNELLSDKIVPTCSSCGCKLPENSKFAICENCFKERRFSRGRRGSSSGRGRESNSSNSGDRRRGGSRGDGKSSGGRSKSGGTKKGGYGKKRSRKRKYSGSR